MAGTTCLPASLAWFFGHGSVASGWRYHRVSGRISHHQTLFNLLRQVGRATLSSGEIRPRTDRGLEQVVLHAALVVLENAADHSFYAVAEFIGHRNDVALSAVRRRVHFQAVRAVLIGIASLEVGVGTQRPQRVGGAAQEASQVVGFRAGSIRRVRERMRTYPHPGGAQNCCIRQRAVCEESTSLGCPKTRLP